MLKKTITYTDFDGKEWTEDFYFHLSKAHLMDMETSVEGGYSEMLKKISKAPNGAEVISMLKKFILSSYGVKSEDGKHFYQSPEISKEFESTEAYSELLTELCTNADAAISFITGIFPFTDEQRKEVITKAQEAAKATTTELPANT